ncbi:MAG: hypothetical protein P4N24_15530 [Acidobacteriota bacterium]|nr:hypothetical protein [Acidobacteriota bacterium]
MKVLNYPKALWVIFGLTLSLVNPLVLGDGAGYYSYVRSILVQHNLRFEDDWLNSNMPFVDHTVDARGRINARYTETGHLPNHYSVGPSMLWAPFLVPIHLVMVALVKAGISVKANGFTKPYLVTAALATALYGFLGLYLSFRFARLFVAEIWAFLATLGIWFASSLPVYMYFNPFYSHAQSAFSVAIFLWYWHRTRVERTVAQWGVLGLISGLMLNIYYLNIAILLLPLLESLRRYWLAWRVPGHDQKALRTLLLANTIYCCVTVAAFLPTLITRQIIYGNPLQFGYEPSSWMRPALWQTLFSSNHGLLLWTPMVIISLVGLVLLRRSDRELSAYCLAAFVAMGYIVACHPDWHGVSSFGNRFFISLTPFFILGLAVFLQEASRRFAQARTAVATSVLVIGALMVWNMAFIFQWGIGLIPHVGPISWKQMAYNQVVVVPARLGGSLKSYFTNRGEMMERLKIQDIQRVRREYGAGKTNLKKQ